MLASIMDPIVEETLSNKASTDSGFSRMASERMYALYTRAESKAIRTP